MRRNPLGAVLGALLVAVLIGLVPGTAGAVAGHKKPGAPTAPAVIPANTAVVVSWSPPTSPGSSPVEGYTVTVQQKHAHP